MNDFDHIAVAKHRLGVERAWHDLAVSLDGYGTVRQRKRLD